MRRPASKCGGQWIGVLATSLGLACGGGANDRGTVTEALNIRLGNTGISCRIFGTCEDPVLTHHNDNGRTGASNHPGIRPAEVAQRWSWLATLYVDGNVYAQPLYMPLLRMRDGRSRSVVFVATSHNHVDAFDADNYELLWDNTGPHWDDADETDPALNPNGRRLGCATVSPGGIGILSTPVIDAASRTMFVSYRSLVPGQGALQGRQWIRRIDITSGATLGGDREVVIEPGATRTPANDATRWEPGKVRQRASLLLDHGTLYVAFAMRCEELWTDYHGWMFAYDVSTPGTIRNLAVLNTTPTTSGGGIWQASGGPSADAQGHVYFMTGNNMHPTWAPPSPTQLAGSFVRLSLSSNGSGKDFVVDDMFTPYRADWQQVNDMDLGSSAPVLVPGLDRLVGGGKEGILYVVDTNHLGGFDTRCDLTQHVLTHAQRIACGIEYNGSFQPDNPSADAVVQKIASVHNQHRTPTMNDWGTWPHIHGTPVVSNIEGALRLYVWAEKDSLRSFIYDGTRFIDGPSGSTVAPDQGMPGGMLSLSIDPGSSQGVLWGSVPKDAFGIVHGELFAYDPVSLQELWNNANDNYLFGKFVSPTAADGKVFLATLSGEVLVYGERKAPRSEIAVANQAPNQLDLVTIADDGSLVVSWELNDGLWQSPPVSITPPRFAPPGGGVTLAKQGDHQLDAFLVGNDGAIYVTWAVDLGPWAAPVALTGPSFARPGADLAARSQGPTQLDLFVVDANGRVNVLWVQGLGIWQGPVGLTGPGFAPSGAHLATDSQGSNQIDLFVVANSGAVNVLWVVGSGIWAGPVGITAGGFAPPGAGLATSHQGPDQLDLFVVGNSGAAYVLWVVGGGIWAGPVAITAGGFAPPGGSVATGYQGANQVDLFVVSNSGAANVLWVVGGGIWAGPASISGNGFAPPGAPVAAIAQHPNQLDLLVGGYHHSVSWVIDSGIWQGPARIF